MFAKRTMSNQGMEKQLCNSCISTELLQSTFENVKRIRSAEQWSVRDVLGAEGL